MMNRFNEDISGKLITYFQQKLGVREHHTGWWRQGTCPECGKEKKFGINILMNRSNCFSCAYRPRPFNLMLKLEGLKTYREGYNFLKAFDSTFYTESKIELLETKQTELPESFRLLSLGNSNVAKIARRYMENRGFNIFNLTMKGVGYCTQGRYAFRIIIPFYERGALVYFNAREFINTGQSHLNPGTDEFGIGKAMLMYNADALYIYRRVYLVESAINALTLGDRAFTIGGKISSDYQVSDILKSPCREVVIILDPDAEYEALKLGMTLVNHKRVKVILLPKIKSKKDPEKFLDINNLGKKRVMEIVHKTPWQSHLDLYKVFINTPKPIHAIYEEA